MSDGNGDATTTLVRALSGASFGLGVSELVAPGKVATVAGVDDTVRSRRVIRALGLRECGLANHRQRGATRRFAVTSCLIRRKSAIAGKGCDDVK